MEEDYVLILLRLTNHSESVLRSHAAKRVGEIVAVVDSCRVAVEVETLLCRAQRCCAVIKGDASHLGHRR
eukprot:3482612-Karenia_brevis.AAC.1